MLLAQPLLVAQFSLLLHITKYRGLTGWNPNLIRRRRRKKRKELTKGKVSEGLGGGAVEST